MRYLLAFLFPPAAVLLCGKPIQAIFNVVLTMLIYVPGVIHALMVIHGSEADQRQKKLISAADRREKKLIKALGPQTKKQS
jgi:uncharacterized membrane protein YqaE (UPF0057 family)